MTALGNKQIFSTNLLYYMNKNGVSRNELSEKLQIKYSTLCEWISAKKYPRIDNIEKIANYFNVPKSALIEQRGTDAYDSNPIEIYEKYPNIKSIKKVKIPMLGNIACGEPIFADEEHETYIETDGHIQADFCLTCAGDSMLPKIESGDIVFIHKQEIVDDGQIAAVIIEDEATLKRVYYDKSNNILRLIAENPKYDPLIYTGEQLNKIRIIGKAVSLYRKIK